MHFLCNGSVIRRWTNETSNQFILQVNGLVSCPERSQGQSIAHKAPPEQDGMVLLLLRWKPQIFRYFLFDCLLGPGFCCWKNGRFQFCVLISTVIYPVIVWTQGDSSYLVGIFDAFMNPFSGFLWIKKYDVVCTIHILCMGGYSSVKRPNDVFTKEFLWLSLYSIWNKQKAWNSCEEACMLYQYVVRREDGKNFIMV